MTLSVSGTGLNTSHDDSVTVTHFSLDSWGKIEQTTTPFTPKSNPSQNPFNPFINSVNEVAHVNSDAPNTDDVQNDKTEDKSSTNPFIDSNPFFGLLNPFKDLGFSEPATEKKEKKEENETKNGSKIVKEEVQPMNKPKPKVGVWFARIYLFCTIVRPAVFIIRNCSFLLWKLVFCER